MVLLTAFSLCFARLFKNNHLAPVVVAAKTNTKTTQRDPIYYVFDAPLSVFSAAAGTDNPVR